MLKKKFIFSIILILLCSCNFSKEESCFKCKKIFEGSDITYWASAAYEDHGTEQGCFEHIEITSEDISEHELFFPDFNIDVEGKGFKTYECHMGDEQKLIWKEIPNSCWICLNPNIENELGQEFEFASESDIDGSCRLWTSNDKEDYLFLDESYLTIANTKCKKETNGGLSWDYIPNSCWICPDNLGNQMFPSDINIDFSCRLWSEEDDKYYYLKEYNIKKHCVIKDQKFHWENPLMTYATSQKRTEDPFNFYYFNWDNRCWLCEKEMDDGKSKLFAVNYENQWDDQGCQNYRRLDLTELYTRGTTYIDYYTNWLYGLGTPKCKITVENGKIKANWDDRHWNNCLICKNEEEYIAVSGNDYYKDCTYWSSIDAEQYPDDDGKIRTCIETEGYMEWKDPIIDIKDVFVEKTSEFNIFEEEDICANFEDKIQEKQGKKVGLTKDLFEEGTSTDAKENNPCNECTDKGSHFISKYSERSLDGTNACCPNFFDYVKEGKCSSDYYENLLDCDFTKGLECTSMDEKTILPSEQKAYFNPKKRSVFFNKDSYLRYDLERELYVESGVVEIEFIPRWDSNQHLQGAKRILHIPLKEGNFEVIRYIEPKIESGWMTSNPVPSSLLFDKIVPHAISGNVWKRNDKVNLVIEWGDFGTRTYVNGKFLNTYGEKPNIKTSDNGIIFIGNGGLNPLEYITGGEEEYIKVRLISSNINSFVYDLDDRKDMIENNDPIIIKGSGEKRLRDILGGKIDGSTKMVGFESTGIILESDDTDEPLILDCEDLTLAGDFRSNGIEIIGTDNVIIRNCIIKNFRWGVYIGQASKITIEDNSISDNYDDASAIACFSLFDNPYYYDWRPVCGPWTKYGEEFDVNSGGGIYIKDSYDVIVDNNYLQNQGVGITMISSHKCNILHNYADHNSGYGIHLVKSNNNYIFNNDFSYTNRFCGAAGPSQKGGCDSAAIMLEYNSNNNRFIKNDATYSGDGVFLRGKTEDSVLIGSHNNYFEENDVSNSPHNGFEFANSDENEFIANIVNHCDYGFYSHFSKDTIIRNNEIQYNNNEGISLRYAENALIENNDFIGNPIDIYLWEQPNEDMTKKPSLFADKRSYKNVIIGNMHEKVTISGLILEDSTSSEVKKNKYNCEYTYQRTWNNHDIGCALTVISNFDENMNEGDSLGEFKENQFIGLYGKKPVISNQYLSEKEVIAYASSNYWDIDNIDDISVIGHVQIEPVLQI